MVDVYLPNFPKQGMPLNHNHISSSVFWIHLSLKGLFHPAYLARVVSWFAFVVAVFMAYENGDKQRPAKRRHMQGMLDETDPLNHCSNETESKKLKEYHLLSHCNMFTCEEMRCFNFLLTPNFLS